MKISNKIIEFVISEVAGVDVVPLVNGLKNKKNVSEFKIAEHIKKEINETRNMLYRLYHANLVSFIRKKDKKKGWYIYYWTFNMKRVRYLAIDLKKKRLEIVKERLQREKEGTFYICSEKCIRLDFEQAMDFEFKCPECGKIIDLEKKDEIIDRLQKETKLIESELKSKR